VNNTNPADFDPLPPRSWIASTVVLGTICGALSAVGYTAANICLRGVAETCDPVWVSFIKAVPTAVVAGMWLLLGWIRGQRIWPRRGVLISLLLAGLFGQLAGNVFFQYALGVIGIGLTVPICMGMIIIASAVLARVYLSESVTHTAMLSMMVLILAIWVLSMGAGDAFQSIAEKAPSWWQIVVGVGAALLSGLAYAVLGVVIRFGVSGRASIAATTFIVAIVGVATLGALTLGRIGWQGVLETNSRDWIVMVAAGVFNFLAFWALAKALQLTSVVYVNALNASQVAMAATAGVVLFGESFTFALTTGVALTVVGLLMMRPDRPKPDVTHRPSEPTTERCVQNEQKRSSSSVSLPSSHIENSVVVAGPPELSTTCSSGGDDTESVA
jgi:drug/metabolite transporter (DMT)-like permease